MNAKTIIAAVALALGSASSFAENPTWRVSQVDESPSTLTRDEVRAELDRANAAGEVFGTGYGYWGVVQGSRSAAGPDLTRAQVKAELAVAQKNGELTFGGLGARSEREVYPGLYPSVQPMAIAHSSAAANAN